MTKITSKIAYKATMERIEELLPLVDDNTPLENKNLIELKLSDNTNDSMLLNIDRAFPVIPDAFG